MGIFKSFISNASEAQLHAALDKSYAELAHLISEFGSMSLEDKAWYAQANAAWCGEVEDTIKALEARLAEIDALHGVGDKLAA